MMHFTEYQQGDMLTITMELRLPDATYTATLSGHMRSPIVEGLLWWAFGHCLDHVVSRTMTADGEALSHLYTRTPFYESDDARARRIVSHFRSRMPELAPLASTRPDLSATFDMAVNILVILHDRLHCPDSGVLHGVENVYHRQEEAA